ncbi:MAG TPA: Hsp20/alpha crystallin family protein [Terriglobales bacterium]|nr:Hsp20/alpha crystallin family protein [Terriglobales bacterium]
MAITRWDPFRELTSLQSQMNRLFQETSRGTAQQAGDEFLTTGTFVPPVDIYETENNIVLKLEVPGIQEKDIDVRVQDHTLVVRGERKFEEEEKQENFHRIERSYGAFSRSFTLPNTVDTENVSATYENGVLNITLAKRAEAKPKQIKVNAGPGPQKTIESKGGAGKAA